VGVVRQATPRGGHTVVRVCDPLPQWNAASQHLYANKPTKDKAMEHGLLQKGVGVRALDVHHAPKGWSDKVAYHLVKSMRVFADAFFSKRYGHRAVVLETVAAVPGMVGGLLQHLKALRHIRDDQGWIKELIDEADNERMHLMTFIQNPDQNPSLQWGDPERADASFLSM
jgi:hypothetical protein